jgi:hypothetical protein
MRGLLMVAAAALALPAGGALAAAQIKQPDCAALEAWGAHVNAETYSVAPRLDLPKALDDTQVVPLFGVGVLAWTPEDLQAANQLLTKCYGAAGARRDAAAAGALANANRALQGLVPRTNAVLLKAKTDDDALKQQIGALPDSPELDRGLAALVKANPAQPDVTPFRTLPHEVGDPLWRLASQVLPVLANSERETLFKSFGERRAAIQSATAAAADKTIAAAPADAGGMIELMAVPERVAPLEDAGVKARLLQSADDRAKQIGDALRQAKPAVWVPPSCLDLYRWSGGANAAAGVTVGGRGVPNAFLDASVVPVFGLSLADWSDQDLARFKALRGLCQSEWQALAALPGNTGPSAPELVQLAGRGRWIDAADPQIAAAKTAVAAYRDAQQKLAAALEKARALPDTAASLAPLAQLEQEPAQAMVTPDDRARFVTALNEKAAAISAHASDAAVKGLGDIKIASLDDFKKLLGYVGQTAPTIPDPRGKQAFIAAANRSMDEAAARLLPDFKAKLDAMPASLAGVADANAALARLTGIPDPGRVPAFRPYAEAAQARAAALQASVRAQACADFDASVGAGSDAKQELWDGHEVTTLGEFICRIGEHGKVDGYSGAGLLSSTSTLKATPMRREMLTVSMHKLEIKAGRPMLVGYDVKDPGGKLPLAGDPTGHGTEVSVELWGVIVDDLTGFNGAEVDECMKIIDNPAPDKLAPAVKVFWLYCGTLDEVRLRAAQRARGEH